jgi:geranylgeranyl diphosphate synthase type II
MNTVSMDIPVYLADRKQKIDAYLDSLKLKTTEPYSILYDAAAFALAGGKRLRPILALATCDMLGGHLEQAIAPVCSLELVHTYSLIHDDLPCMDNDDYRRGRPTLHRQFPEAIALLAGDYLLTRAFELIASSPGLTAEQRIELTHILSSRAGGHGMIGGQVMDILAEGHPIDLPKLSEIHRRKTGDLITAAIEFGAVIAHANPDERKHLTQFGAEVGLAFQIIDDVIDVTASVEKHGKATSTDASKGKITYVQLMGIDKAKQTAEDHLHRGLEILRKVRKETFPLSAIAEKLVYRNI